MKTFIAFIGFISSGMSFGLTVDEFNCHLSLKDVRSGASLGSSSFMANPVRKESHGLPPTTSSQIQTDLNVGKTSVNVTFDFQFQTGSGVEMANFSQSSNLTVCFPGTSQEISSNCNSLNTATSQRDVDIENGVPIFPESNLSAKIAAQNVSIEVSCMHVQTYP
jgi:hypothetical protein